MKLITETIESVKMITEEKNGVKTLYIQGPFLVAEAKNRNVCTKRKLLQKK